MAPRSRRAAAAAAAKEAPPTEEEDSMLSDAGSEMETGDDDAPPAAHAEGSTGLNFNEPLMGRPGRPIPVATLLKRLQKLSEELKSLDQDVPEEFKEDCKPVAKELGDSSILAHKDKGVRAWAAQCIVDVLALCAPDAPFVLNQLKAIFEMFIKTIFPALADPTNAYNLQHVYVLESLAGVKSILLITDLPNANKLLTQLFTTFFDIYAGTARTQAGEERVSKHVEYTMLNALVTLVDETEALPQDVVDIVVSQFLRADPRLSGQKEQKTKKGDKVDEKQTTLMRQELPTGYLMAKDICNMVSEKMSREVSKYFSEVIMESSGIGADGGRQKSGGDAEDGEDGESGLSEEDLNELEKAHRLVRELWRACPAVVQNVVPQLEVELTADNVQLRVMATETLGDLVSGIGAAGPPSNPAMDAAAYPPLSLSRPSEPIPFDPMTTPKAPQPFSQAHSQAYQSLLGRRQDKSPAVRAAWTTAIGRALTTNAGGVGIGQADEKRLVEDLARMLNDSEERVRLAAVKAIGAFSCMDAVSKLGSIGGVDQEGSVLNNLAVHVKDKKAAVRSEAMTVLARLWGVAHAEIAEGNEQVVTAIGGIPSHLLNTYYTNSTELFEFLDKAIFEELLPLNYPPLKSKNKDKTNGSSQRTKDTQPGDTPEQDADSIRAERILLLVHGLDERAKRIFYSFSPRQKVAAQYMQLYLQTCESHNGGVMDKGEGEVKDRMTKVIKIMSDFYPDQQRVSTDLWKFAKMHDRRSYQLIKFCIDPKSDYSTVRKAIRELTKRVTESSNPTLNETLVPFMYRVGLLIYNRSHVPAILGFSKTNEKGLSSTAHEVLKDMSTQRPEILESHIRDMCQSLQDDVPTASKANNPGAIDNLKACAAFARKFPQKLPQDRKFIQALSAYTTQGSPPAVGKYAVTIIMAASPKKEAAAKEIFQKCLKGFVYGEPGFITRLASLSQIMLLAPKESESSAEAVFDIALKGILAKTRAPAKEPGYIWSSDFDDECSAKLWAIKIMTNRLRSHPDDESLPEVAGPVLDTLTKLVANEGELSPSKDTPAEHKPQLRVLAAASLLKLSRSHAHDLLLDPTAFEKLAEMVQDGLYEVRRSFSLRLRKYLNRSSLPSRYYAIPFLLAYEPVKALKSEMTTWLKGRTSFFATQARAAPVNGKTPTAKPKAPTTMEATIPRLLSLLAHHPDYDDADTGLRETAQYILFYLACVATAENVSLIYHLAQRVKAHRDAVFKTSRSTFSTNLNKSEASIDFDIRLHTLSDLSCAIIRSFVEVQSWNIQTLPGRAKLPLSLFSDIEDHDEAITIAEKDFISEELREALDKLVHDALRKRSRGDGNRKRKSEAAGAGAADDDDAKAAKRAKRSGISGRSKGDRKSKGAGKRKHRTQAWNEDDGSDTGNRRRKASAAEKERRKSGRASSSIKYRERDDDEDDDEMLGGVAEWEYENGERWREPGSSSEDEDGSDEDDDESGSDAGTGAEGEVDAEMQDDEEEDDAASSPPPATKGGQAGKATPKSKAVSSRAAASKANARSSGTATPAKASPAAGKEIQKALPTRSGRTTRSAAT